MSSGKCLTDVSRLINMVQCKPALWDRQHPQHHHRTVQDHHWDCVATALGISVKAARGKWKNLKDHFRKEYKRCVANANSDQETSKWPYFHSMMFIRGQICHPVSMFLTDPLFEDVFLKSEITNVRKEERGGVGRGEEWVFTEPEDGNSPPPDDDDDGYRPMNCLNVEYGNLISGDHQQDANNFSDDKHFLLSLLPIFSTLTPDKKLKARIAIETSLLNIAYPDLTVQESGGSGGGDTTNGHLIPRRVVERNGTLQKYFTPRIKTNTPEPTLTATIAKTSTTPTPKKNSTSTLTTTAVVTATATCATVKTENKKRNLENNRLQLPKKMCTANSRKC